MTKMLRLISCVLLTVLVQTAWAEQVRTLESIKFENNQVSIVLSDGPLQISPINQGTVEVFYEPYNTKQLPSFALPDSHTFYQHSTWQATDTGYTLGLPNLNVHIQLKPFKLSFSNAKGMLSEEEVGLFNYETVRGFRFSLDESEKIMGGGQRVLGMDRRGHRMPLYNKAHYGYNGESNQMYYGLPAVMSNKGYVIAFDNSANGALDIGHTETNILQFEADAGRTSYLFSAGDNYYQLIENFVSATGKQPLPPRWALGNYASRFGYKSQQEVLSTINKFIESDFPVDAVVLDLYWFGADIKGHMGNLSWDKKHWPNPEAMIETLRNKGVKTIVITEPFILSSSSQWQSALDNKALARNQAGKPRRFDFYFGNTGLVDVFDDAAQDWFWQYYEKLNKQGIAGWWGDLGEPEVHPADTIHNLNGNNVTANEIHNAYGHAWAKMVYEKQSNSRPNERPFIMMRSGFVGSQRYAMVPWTGDVDRSWGGIKPQVELALQMSLFGLAYTHSDLGGFAGGEEFDAELYIRWLQYGVFQPIYRPHAQDHIAPEPIFHDQSTQNIVREYVKLRYRLLPYNYSLSIRNSLEGIPMMRPLFMDFAQQDIDRTDAYMWGDAFLVAPIVNKGRTEKTLRLPQGYWFNLWNDKVYQGGAEQTISAPLEELPVLVKAGAFIPSVANMQSIDNYSTSALTVDYYHHDSIAQSAYTLYDDNGTSPNSIKDDAIQRIKFTAQQTAASNLHLQSSISGKYDNAPNKRSIKYVIHGIKNMPQSVTVDGKSVSLVKAENADLKRAVYDENAQLLTVQGSLVKQLDVRISW